MNCEKQHRSTSVVAGLLTRKINKVNTLTAKGDLRDAIIDLRKELQAALVARHNGDMNAAINDNTYDALFARAAELLKPEPEPRSRKRYPGKSRRGEGEVWIKK